LEFGRTLDRLHEYEEANLRSEVHGIAAKSPRGIQAHREVQSPRADCCLDAVRATRFTFDPSLDRFRIWSPDGQAAGFDNYTLLV
jgi:hypothetical protein